nr:dusky-like [Cucujiformia]
IGQTMTMVLAIKDDENKFDMLVRNCVAHDGKRAPIQLVDQYGCVVRPKIMSKFQKIKNFGPSASVVSFAYFQAFKFPDSMNVHFQCVIQVCRYNCPEPKCGHSLGLPSEYGAPTVSGLGSNLNPEYSQPPHFEYSGLPAAFPDPRHPSGPTGAYSEPNPEIVPAPQAKTSSSSTNSTNLPTSVPQNNPQSENDINLPPPPPPGHHGQYNTVKRKSDIEGDIENNLATLGGRPRSVENISPQLHGVRRKRSQETMNIYVTHVYKREAQEMTDVNTSRIIQVVAPGDVNF